ncbi:MAG: helix-hairpin-helix domain-containing protein [Dyadobacter sp.]|uniref:ComEA family DNA-binding protein n=1 Tax=Dyadobacter sp. TaxID=1914288 RepID=UPI00326386C0
MYKGLVQYLQDYFGISRKEARGALVLILLCFLMIWMPFVFRRWVLPLMPLRSAPPPRDMLDSLANLLEKENQQKFRKPKFYPKKYKEKITRSGRLFDFDPNQVSIAQMEELGIPSFLAKRINKFRSKGGKFRKKEDLLNIYDFPSTMYQRLEPHIVLAGTAVAKRPESAENTTLVDPKKRYPDKSSYSKPSKPALAAFDINTADTAQLVRLRGIGTKLSLRILKFRDALGGFHSTAQYTEIFGLDSLALAELNRYAKVTSEVKKLNVNIATVEELTAHSYLRNKKIATIIVNYRTQHGAFQTIDDLKKVKVIDEATIKKIEPYLSF